MSRPWTTSRTSWAASAITEIRACGFDGIGRPLANLAAGDLANVAHLDSFAKIGVGEGCHRLVFCVLTILLDLLLIALPVCQVHLGNVKLLRCIDDRALRGFDGLLKVLARFENLS